MKKDKLNILWICTDSQRWDTLGCYGNQFVKTPNIDRLAKEGVIFNHCYTQNPLCTPSRGGFLTGRYPITNKLRQNGQNINANEVLVTRLLADNGYTCGLSGKLHLHACNRRFLLQKEYPEFWKRPESEDIISGIEPRINDGYSEFYWDHCPDDKWRASSYTQWVEAKGSKIQYPDREDSRWVKKGMPESLHQTTYCADKAIDFLQRHSEKPWLFSVNIFDPHYTFNPPEEYLKPYLEILETIPLPNYHEGELNVKPSWQKKSHDNGKFGYDQGQNIGHEHQFIKASYWAMIDLIDVQVGRILDALEKSGQKENTMVIFTSDHGEMLGDHGLYIKGPFLYDPAIRVPLIISCPSRIKGGRKMDTMVELNDLAPTLLSVSDLPIYEGMQARSLWPLLAGETEFHRDSVYSEYYNSNPDNPKIYLTMVRNQNFKIIVAHGNEEGELYDLINDPNETNNLWKSQQHQNVKCDMMKLLCDRMAHTADPLPERVGIY